MHDTNHGMYKNSRGKAWITEETAKKKQDLFSLKQVSTPIPLYWKGMSDNSTSLNPLNPELNPICYLLALLAHHFLHVSRIRVKSLTLRLLMSYIYIYIWSAYS